MPRARIQTGGRRIGLNLMRCHELAEGDVAGVLEAARIADRAGVAEVHLSDHVAVSEAARSARAGFPYALDFPWLEPISVLSAVAACTERVVLATNILVAPLRPAILLAKQLATVDVLSRGRLEVAFGAGWQVEEFEAAGVAFSDRYEILEEQMAVCRLLWAQAPAAFAGKHIRFHDLCSFPQPVQGAGLPISLGMHLSGRGVERVVRLADGWVPVPSSAAELVENLNTLRQECDRQGRDFDALKISAPLALADQSVDYSDAGTLPDPMAEARSLFAAGADVVIAHPLPHCRDLEDLERFVADLVRICDDPASDAARQGSA